MTVKDIALSAATLLQADDIEEALNSDDEQALLDADVKTLLKCVNLALFEASTDSPVIHTQALTATDGVIPVSDIAGGVYVVKRVTRGGECVRFSFDHTGITVPSDGQYTVSYVRQPADAQPSDAAELGAGMTADIVAMLAARDYCLVTGRTDEASIWDQRYSAEAEKLRISRRAYLPKRRWI